MELNFQKEPSKTAKGKYIAFLISPILGLVMAIKTIRTRSSFVVFILFAAIFGLCLYVPAEKEGVNLSVDSTYYRQGFETINVNETFSTWCSRLHRYVTGDIDWTTGEIIKDYYLETVGFVSSWFSDSYHLLFMFATVIFSFFMLKSLKFLVLDKEFKISYYTLCLLFLFTYNQLINMHWLRFPTAAWVTVYMLFQVFVNNNKKYWLLLPFTIVIHGSFIAFALIVGVYFLTKKYERFWKFAFVGSLFFASIPPSFLDSILNYFPSFLSRYLLYATADTIEERADLIAERRTGVLIELFAVAINVYMNVLMLYLIKDYNKVKKEMTLDKLFMFLLILFTIVNMLVIVKEMSERYRMILFPIFTYLWYQVYKNDPRMPKIIYLIPFVFAYQIALNGYLYYMTCDYSLFVTPIYAVGNFLMGN